MNISELRSLGRDILRPLVDSQDLPYYTESTLAIEVDVFLTETLGRSMAEIYAHGDEFVSTQMESVFLERLNRRREFEPVSYILGKREFYGIEFYVNPYVLIPRPETELLVELVLSEIVQSSGPLRIADIGTGSGAIIIAVASEVKNRFGFEKMSSLEFIGIDKCENALAVAQINAAKYSLSSHIKFLQGDLLESLSERPLCQTIIVANPPYISGDEILPADVENFEPKLALRAGEKGLDIIRQLLAQAVPFVSNSAKMFIEISHTQAADVVSLAEQLGLRVKTVHHDYSNRPRAIEVSQ